MLLFEVSFRNGRACDPYESQAELFVISSITLDPHFSLLIADDADVLQLATLSAFSFSIRFLYADYKMNSGRPKKIPLEGLVLESIMSPRRSASFRRPKDELGSWSTLVKRHRFLLVALGLLVILCTVYLYFAITLGAGDSCSGLSGDAKVTCQMEHVKDFMARRKLKLL
ncbi:hypothetical protein AHAS_Ahas20G0046400 [Arachis hypogaea]